MKKTVFCLPIGVVNINSGATMYDWSIYDEFWNNKMFAFLASNGFLIFSSNELDFEIGDIAELRGNDTQRLLKTTTIIDKVIVTRQTLTEMLLNNKYDYRPAKAFKKKEFSRKLSTSYSVKGITN